MAKGKLIVICQSGGKFNTASDGSLSYTGGDAHAITLDRKTKFSGLMKEIVDIWKCDRKSVIVKYFLPNNTKTLITISTDKDVQRLIDFHENSSTVDLFVMKNESSANEASLVACSSSSKNTMVEPVTPIDAVQVASSNAAGDSALFTTPAPMTGGEIVDVRTSKLLKSWENCLTGLHQQFNDVEELRDALRKYSIAHGFICIFKKNDSVRVSAKCKAEGCTWRIYASKLSTTKLFRVKKINNVHTCGVETGRVGYLKASRKMVASIFKEKLTSTPNSRPKEIAEQMRQEFGIEVRYSQARRGMESAREQLLSTYKEAYNQLPGMCEKILETNPGSAVTLVTREDQKFHRLFVSFHASIHGFQNGCRPLLFLDTITLKTKYQSELLAATALDGNDGIFPVAFAIVDVVNDDNWHWFLLQLKSALLTSQPITFIADRRMGLRQSISLVFENSYHGYCVYNLSEELKNNLKGPHSYEVIEVIVTQLYDAALAPTLEGFRKCIENIRNISPEAYEWLLQSEPEHWADSLFAGLRYKHLISGIAEPFYSSVSEGISVVMVMDTIRCKLMELIYTRKVESEKWLTRLTPLLEEKLQKEVIKAQTLQVPLLTGSTFEVQDSFGAVTVVNLDTWDCSCGEWQLNGFPCFHAVAVLQRIDRSVYDYCSKYYAADTFRLCYSKSINPVPSVEKPVRVRGGESPPILVHPPSLRYSNEPPKERRIRRKKVVKRPLHCSICKGEGHNRSTCQLNP